jgi:5-(carboxyamino)imidazole ribonucleotide synthase
MNTSFISTSKKLGILGGGQLGKMLLQCTNTWDIFTKVLEPSTESACKNLCNQFTNGSLQDFETVYNFGKNCDVLTIEIEHVNVEALKQLKAEGVIVHPNPSALETIQDKGLQKIFYQKNNFPTSEFILCENKNEAFAVAEKWNFETVQKSRKAGYDGKGVYVCSSKNEANDLMDLPCVMERKIKMKTEISVIAARNENDEVRCYPAVEMDFHDGANMLDLLLFPAQIDTKLAEQAESLATQLISAFDICGLLAVEFFVDENNNLLINEVAPRPHNSGHQTIESSITSQYEQHIRGILNLPLGSTEIKMPSAMVNLLGAHGFEGDVYYEGLNNCLKKEGVKIHIYGKKKTKPFRKMGHVTVLHNDIIEAKKTAQWVKENIIVKCL